MPGRLGRLPFAHRGESQADGLHVFALLRRQLGQRLVAAVARVLLCLAAHLGRQSACAVNSWVSLSGRRCAFVAIGASSAAEGWHSSRMRVFMGIACALLALRRRLRTNRSITCQVAAAQRRISILDFRIPGEKRIQLDKSVFGPLYGLSRRVSGLGFISIFECAVCPIPSILSEGSDALAHFERLREVTVGRGEPTAFEYSPVNAMRYMA